MGPETVERPDRTLRCVECQQAFTWSRGEQEFFAAKGLAHPPRRCRACRVKRRVESGDLTEAVCAQCGARTAVPFVPTGSRPVLCDPCHEGRSASR